MLYQSKTVKRVLFTIVVLIGASYLTGCATRPPADPENLCYVFEEKHAWYRAAYKAQRRWGIPIAVNMAFIYQESGFRAKAKPPRKWYLGFIPGRRPSSAYGYAQALDGTWKSYQRDSGRWGADRDNFSDAIDFVGWYNRESNKLLKIPRSDARRLYLVYHEGAGGYRRGTYKKKKRLLQVAQRVDQRAKRYQQQLSRCEDKLKRPWWRRLF